MGSSYLFAFPDLSITSLQWSVGTLFSPEYKVVFFYPEIKTSIVRYLIIRRKNGFLKIRIQQVCFFFYLTLQSSLCIAMNILSYIHLGPFLKQAFMACDTFCVPSIYCIKAQKWALSAILSVSEWCVCPGDPSRVSLPLSQ